MGRTNTLNAPVADATECIALTDGSQSQSLGHLEGPKEIASPFPRLGFRAGVSETDSEVEGKDAGLATISCGWSDLQGELLSWLS